MEEVTKFLDGFKVITTPYDKVDTSIINKRNIKTVIKNLDFCLKKAFFQMQHLLFLVAIGILKEVIIFWKM